MEKIWHFRTPEEFDSFLLKEGAALALEAAECLKATALAPTLGKLSESVVMENPTKDSNGYLATVLFMGPVFGEFIISCNQETANRYFSTVLTGTPREEMSEMICEALAEVLNQTAGKRMRSLNQIFRRMTMSVPKVTEGKVHYRSIRSAQRIIETEFGDFEVSLYIDQMKTDLADAHREMIDQLKCANLDLEKVNKRIKDQQTQLVQSEKMASLGLMAAGVAHEINNPLSFVMANVDTLADYVGVTTRLIDGYSTFIKQLLEREPKEMAAEIAHIKSLEEKNEIDYVTSDSQKLIQESKDGLERIKRIVSGLKRFSRQDSDNLRTANVNEEILNTLELLRNELKYNCKIETDLKPTRELICLPNELCQVFVNLLMNAAQAMPESGGRIKIESFEQNNALVIRFIDTGAGMPPEVIEKLFQPFFTTKPIGKGTGLGLAISYGIIERHGGSISVESSLGKGSTFTITLPYLAADLVSKSA